MPFGKRQRKLLVATGLFLAVLLVLWFSLPLWLPWALGPIARMKGAQYSSYKRLDYGHFVLRDFQFTNSVVTVRAKHIEALVPSLWLWRHLVGENKGGF